MVTDTPTTLTIVYFAWVREAIDHDEDHIPHPGPEARIADVIASLERRGGDYAQAFADTKRLRAALDQQFAPLDSAVGNARELALFPPVTGG